MAETKNHLGLDKFQVTVIKSNYNSTKPIRKMIEKAQAKISSAKEKYNAAIEAAKAKYEESVKDTQNEVQAYQQQIDMLDKFTLETTKNACGLELTTEQVIEFLDNPAAFVAYKAEKNGQDMFDMQQPESPASELPWDDNVEESRDLDAEEDKDWEDRIQSGEIKEAV